MSLALWIIIFLVSLFVLIKAADYFITSSEKIGLAFGIPSFLVGVVIVGIGTSLPELASAFFAVSTGSSEIVIGNVLGSNIANIFLVMGVTAVLGRHITVRYDLLRVDLPFLLGSSLLLALMVWDLQFSLGEALLCLVSLGVYIFHSIHSSRDQNRRASAKPKLITWSLLFISPVFIYFGAKYTIDSVIAIAEILSIGTEVIAMSAIALGTSLPEILVTISATRRGKPEIAVGNIIGSNIFNAFAVMGFPALFGKVTIPASILHFPLLTFIAATFIYVIVTVDRRINHWIGMFMLLFYIYFILKIFGVV